MKIRLYFSPYTETGGGSPLRVKTRRCEKDKAESLRGRVLRPFNRSLILYRARMSNSLLKIHSPLRERACLRVWKKTVKSARRGSLPRGGSPLCVFSRGCVDRQTLSTPTIKTAGNKSTNSARTQRRSSPPPRAFSPRRAFPLPSKSPRQRASFSHGGLR